MLINFSSHGYGIFRKNLFFLISSKKSGSISQRTNFASRRMLGQDWFDGPDSHLRYESTA